MEASYRESRKIPKKEIKGVSRKKKGTPIQLGKGKSENLGGRSHKKIQNDIIRKKATKKRDFQRRGDGKKGRKRVLGKRQGGKKKKEVRPFTKT